MMNFLCKNKKHRFHPFSISLSVILVLYSLNTWSQGVIQMPEVKEVPDLERESLLLDMDIPAVRDRDPDPEAGERLNIKEFRLQGIVEYPALGITREAIQQRVETIRFDLMREGLVTDFGDFTLDELGEIGGLVRDIERDTPAEHVGPLEVQKFVFLVRDQMRRRGVTVGMIESVALEITNFYRERGFILAKAFIPKQQVRDGIVAITLLLGELGEVKVEDNKRVSENLIKQPFKRDINKPVTNNRIDESLYLVNDIPGVRAQGFFSPGAQVGDTLLTTKILEEKWTTFNLRIDNHGSENTSENRAYADVYVHNPLGIGDEIHASILNSYNPDNSTYGSLRYSSFIFSPRVRGSLGYSTNDFVSRNLQGSSDSFFSGESTVTDVRLSYHFKRGRTRNFSTDVSYSDIDTSLDTNVGSSTRELVEKVSLGFNFDILNEKRRELYIGNFSLHNAETFENGFFGDVTSDELFATFDLSMITFFKVPFTGVNSRALFKTSMQYAGESLSNLNQLNLTGPSRLRAFGVNGLQADDAIYLGADWIFNLPQDFMSKMLGSSLRNAFQPYVFIDGAYGVINPITENDEEIVGRLANIGVGLRASFLGFNGSLAVSKVITDDIDFTEVETPRSNIYFELQYTF